MVEKMQESSMDVLVGFGRRLRADGLAVGTGRILNYCRAAAVLAPLDRERLYWAGRTTLVARPEDLERYDSAFSDYFDRGDLSDVLEKLFQFADKTRVPQIETAEEEGARAQVERTTGLPDDAESTEGDAIVAMVASSAEVLRNKSFDKLSAAELRRVAKAIRTIQLDLPLRRARRLARAPLPGNIDMRRTLRYSLRTHGEPFRRAWKARRTRIRPLVLILDISASMSAFSHALLQFGYAAMNAGRAVEVFCFGTRLTRITRLLRTRDPDEALSDVTETLVDWDGGTRIGDSLKQLLDRYSQTAQLRGAVVVMCSDGLERGDPELLAAQMARLGRLAHKVVWVNPLAGDIRYQPLARGMAAALPHVDVFMPGHNLASVEALARVVAL
jgi:uncharacterized protein